MGDWKIGPNYPDYKRWQRRPERPWARSHDRCVECKTTEYVHHSRGLCLRCRGRLYHGTRKATAS